MIAMKFTIEPDIGRSFLLQAALPQLVTDRETKTHPSAIHGVLPVVADGG